MAGTSIRSLILATAAVAALAACAPGKGILATKPVENATDTAPVTPARSVKLVDRDVEAPEVFNVSDDALWDGRPSLGGVWVASPDAIDPERVILRNPSNGKFVIGALFRRERDNPGPRLQISSDAAAALGFLAGHPGKISITALRREEVPTGAPDTSRPILDSSEAVETTAIDTAAMADAAIDRAEGQPAQDPAAPLVSSSTAAPAAPNPTAATSSDLIQVGKFSVEANAKRAIAILGKAGIVAQLRKEESQGKVFWSVTALGDAATLAKIKAAGFTDAYPMKRP